MVLRKEMNVVRVKINIFIAFVLRTTRKIVCDHLFSWIRKLSGTP